MLLRGAPDGLWARVAGAPGFGAQFQLLASSDPGGSGDSSGGGSCHARGFIPGLSHYGHLRVNQRWGALCLCLSDK